MVITGATKVAKIWAEVAEIPVNDVSLQGRRTLFRAKGLGGLASCLYSGFALGHGLTAIQNSPTIPKKKDHS
jgi:hypothetical protein